MVITNELNIMRLAAFLLSACGVMVSVRVLPCLVVYRSANFERSLLPPAMILSNTAWKVTN